ncbi:serine palmitoyltransferase [Chiua virens]|nr:serine palmitoyltransferase [Chiua virens]
MSDTPSSTLEPLLTILAYALSKLESTFYKIPGSAVVARYVKSSHQNDPGRTILELILSRTRGDKQGKHFIQFSEKEINELVDEWIPEGLVQPITEWEQRDLSSVPVIAVSYESRKLQLLRACGNEQIKEKAIETLRQYGLGSCGPPGFYGTIDVHLDLERNIAEFLGTEASILYSQGFSTISSVIPAFCKRGDIIVADRSINFSIQKGIQISRSTVRWYDHNDLKSLEDVLVSIERERKKRRGPLTRCFIITEGIFERDGEMVDLPKLIELKLKYKYRLILDESISFGAVGRTGRGLTELYNVPATQIDMLVGSVANGLCSSGGFCAGSSIVTEHQRINGTSFVFSASMPSLLATSGSEAISYLQNTPSVLTALHDNVDTIRSVLEKTEGITVLGHRASPIIHFCLRNSQQHLTVAPSAPSHEAEERVLQDIVDDALANGVFITRGKHLRSQEMIDSRPTIRIAATAALSKKDVEKAAGIVKASIARVLVKRR